MLITKGYINKINVTMDTTCENQNDTIEQMTPDRGLAGLPFVISGSLIFLLVLPFALFNFCRLRVGSTLAAVVGAILITVGHVVSQKEILALPVFHAAFAMLTCVMVFAHFIEKERIFTWLIQILLRPNYGFFTYMLVTSIIVFISSALLTSDAATVILVPLVIRNWQRHDRAKCELTTLILAMTTSANLGSVLTILGSPQTILIAAKTSFSPFNTTNFTMLSCLIYLLPTAAIAFLFNIAGLFLYYRIQMYYKSSRLSPSEHQGNGESYVMHSESEEVQANGHIPLLELQPTPTEDSDSGDAETESHEIQVDPDRLDPFEGNTPYHKSNLSLCILETIPEDGILEIVHRQAQSLTSLRALSGAIFDLSAIDREADTRGSSGSLEDSNEDELQDNEITYEVSCTNDHTISFAQSSVSFHSRHRSQSFPTNNNASNINIMAEYSFGLSKRFQIYRSLAGVAFVHFLYPKRFQIETMSTITLTRLQWTVFRIVCGLLIMTTLASTFIPQIPTGIFFFAAAILAITVSSILYDQTASTSLRDFDWTIFLLFYGVIVWINGFVATGIPQSLWNSLNLTSSYFEFPIPMVLQCIFVILVVHICGQFITTVLFLSLLIPCTNHLPAVLYFVWTIAISGNMTIYSSITNMLAVSIGQDMAQHRLSFWAHFLYCFVSSTTMLLMGLVVIWGLLHIS